MSEESGWNREDGSRKGEERRGARAAQGAILVTRGLDTEEMFYRRA